MMIKNSKDLLGSMLKTTQMGQVGLRSVMNQPMDPALRQGIRDQLAAYDRIEREARDLLESRAWQVHELGAVSRAIGSMPGYLKRMSKQRDSRIAAMVIQGNTRGVIKGMRNLNHYTREDAPVTELAQRLLETERSSIASMQNFL